MVCQAVRCILSALPVGGVCCFYQTDVRLPGVGQEGSETHPKAIEIFVGDLKCPLKCSYISLYIYIIIYTAHI